DNGLHQKEKARRIESVLAGRTDQNADRPKTKKSPFALGGLRLLNGIALMSEEGQRWIESRACAKMAPNVLRAFRLPWQNAGGLPIQNLRYLDAVFELPPRSLIEKLVAVYCSSFQCLAFPVISRSLFAKTLDLAYGQCGIHGFVSARTCIYAFMALVRLFGFDDELPEEISWLQYANEAERLLPSVIQEMTSDGLQTLVMLTQYQYFAGELHSAEAFVSIASRFIYAFDAHLRPGPTLYDKRIAECHLRDLFWMCYSFDKDLAMRTGQPPTICDAHCDMTLPTGYVQMQNSNIQRTAVSITPYTVPLFPWDLRLSKIKYRVYDSLYSATAFYRAPSEILSMIRLIDDALEEWRLSLHPDFRPSLSFSQHTPVSIALNTQAIMLRLAYYHCVFIVHQASARFLSLTKDAYRQIEGIDGRLSLSVNACRSSVIYLQTALPAIKSECFWYEIQRPRLDRVDSIFGIFSNLLENPLGPSAAADLDILNNFPETVRQIPIRRLTLGEMVQQEFLDDFTTELARLGRCAYEKARTNI
ncbi:hypothetical protein N7461_000469, partial [Penicillium sp. DV-2018c]